jgi:hypothetical protein
LQKERRERVAGRKGWGRKRRQEGGRKERRNEGKEKEKQCGEIATLTPGW